jgi:hypothetical protein
MAPATAASSGPPVDERSRAEPIAAALLLLSGPLIVRARPAPDSR